MRVAVVQLNALGRQNGGEEKNHICSPHVALSINEATLETAGRDQAEQKHCMSSPQLDFRITHITQSMMSSHISFSLFLNECFEGC